MTDRELFEKALEALELAKNSHGVLLMSDPPQDPWKTRRVDSALTQSITALRERLAREEQEPVKESSITHSHLWISDLYGKEKNA